MISKNSGAKEIQQVSIKGILCRDNKVLVLKTARSGRWELPGGRIDFGESVEQTLKREMKEELGFEKVKLGNFNHIWSFVSERNRNNHHFIILDFEIFTDEKGIKLSKEHTEYKWIGADDLDKLNMRERQKESLKKYFKENPCTTSP